MKDIKSQLFDIAARIARREGFLSPEDATRMSRREIVDALKRQDDRIANLAYELGMLARSMPDRPKALDRLPISPIDCQHLGSLLIQSHRSSSPPERHLVTVCPRCGQFTVAGSKEGVYFRVTFDLPTENLVEAAGRYLEYLEAETTEEDARHDVEEKS